MAAFNVERHENLNASVLRISGDLDAAVVPEVRAVLDSLVETGVANVVLDIADVAYADSAAVGMLVWLDRRLQAIDGKMVLSGANRDIRRILEVSQLSVVAPTLCTTGSVDQALENLDLVDPVTPELWSRELQMAASVDNLAAVREEVCRLIDPLSFPESTLFDIRVALGEALANAVRHGAEGPTSTVRVLVRAFDDKIVIEVTDDGRGFDGSHMCSDDLYASGGRGVMFMRALMDQVIFSRSDSGGTVVTLVKHRMLPSAE